VLARASGHHSLQHEGLQGAAVWFASSIHANKSALATVTSLGTEALSLPYDTPGDIRVRMAVADANLGACLACQGSFAEASCALQRAAFVLEAITGPSHQLYDRVTRMRDMMADMALKMGTEWYNPGVGLATGLDADKLATNAIYDMLPLTQPVVAAKK
jgi:hypothetical protein